VGRVSQYGLHIFPQHAKLLGESAIAPEVSRARGYVSADSKKQLERYGFAGYQQHAPGLVIPLHRADGSVWGYQLRPDIPRVTRAGNTVKYETPQGQRNGIDIPPGIKGKIGDPSEPLWATEGSRKADAAVSAGLVCISLNGVAGWRGQNSHGGKLAVADWNDIALNGRRVILAWDSDVASKPAVHDQLRKLARYLETRDAKVEFLHLAPDPGGGKTGLDDFIAANGAGGLWELVRPDLPPVANGATAATERSNISGQVPVKPVPDVPAMTITQVEEVYARWLHDGDKVTTRVVHAVYVANMVLAGDPVWIFLVGGSGQGKTERLAPLSVMPHTELASTLSGEAALLSATARRDRAEHAHGGLLRRIGDKGLLVVKDFTSILEMDRTARGQVLAALREVYDGRWDREVGAEGGQTLTWVGKCGFLAGCTTAIDKAHSVMNDMGPRSLFVRLPPADLGKIAGSALDHMGREHQMREELAAASAGLLTHLTGKPHDAGGNARRELIALASLVSQARSPVHRDWSGEIELIGDAEAPTRIIKQLGQLWRACGVLGLGTAESWEVVRRCALDSIPKLRGAVIRYLATLAGPANTTTVGIGVVHPTKTVKRALEDLAAHGVVERESGGQGRGDLWQLSDGARSWIGATGTWPEMLESPVDDDNDACASCGRRYRPPNETGLCYDCRGGAA
jgi:hypothetical protein